MSLRGDIGRMWAHFRGRRYGQSMLTATGLHYWPLDPRSDEVMLEDIARGLANRCRYSGQTSVDLDADSAYYSVAEHSVIVSTYVERFARDAGWSERAVVAAAGEGLLHDGAEAYIGDMIRPLKYTPEMREFRRIEDRNVAVIFAALGISSTKRSRHLVETVDDQILCDETCMRKSVDVEGYARHYGPPLGAAISALLPEHAEYIWTERFVELWHRGAFPNFEPGLHSAHERERTAVTEGT